ncbi:hypothetical protein CEE39_05790 [bacterium (candidate division B38) B3_B38]|nr:MAG: hypothetical protein CEE39_05790 [bacterium (candidate division B38) B3_B38]
MKARYSVLLMSAIFLLASLPLSAYEAQQVTKQKEGYVLQAAKVDQAPDIDGHLEEELWQKAPAAGNFVQKQPDEGKPATEKTEVRILYDNKNVYIGIMCYDSEPQNIIANEKRRDSEDIYENDHVRIMLDTFHDRRNGYIFVINPLGAKLDLQVRKEGKREGGWHIPNPNVNIDWDGVWKVRSTIHQKGWSAEIEIPFATLRFDQNPTNGWGLNFLRNVRRKNEESTWAPLPRNLNLYKISMAGELQGLEGLGKVLNLQVKPFALVGGTSRRDAADRLTSEGVLDGGIDLKYGVTSNLTLDITYNTEFSQVEADYQQINLTRFSLYFPEKRDFFLENAAIFSIGSPDDAMIFFSRRIGISPQGEEIPLLGGLKLAGKAGRFNIGLINLQAQAIGELPANNFTVLRLSRDILGKSAIGLMVTNRQSEISGDFNRAFCLDSDFILGDNFSMSGYFAGTSSPGLEGRNRAAKLGFQWISDLWDCYGYYFDIQENFNAEMGFVKRTGIRRFQTHLGFTPEPDIKGVKQFGPHIFFAYTADQENNLLLREEHVHFPVNFINGGHIALQWNEDHEFVDFPFPIRQDITVPVGTYTARWWQADFSTNRSLRLYGSMSYRWGGFYSGNSRILNVRTGWRPTPSFASEISVIYNYVNLPQGDFANHLLRARMIYNFSTRLALMSLIQWNGDTDEVDVNIRLNFIHKPGSDLFIVYNESRLVEGLPSGIRDRALLIKFTYLFNL